MLRCSMTLWIERAHVRFTMRSTQKRRLGLSAHEGRFDARSTQENFVWVERAHPPHPPGECAAPRRHTPWVGRACAPNPMRK